MNMHNTKTAGISHAAIAARTQAKPVTPQYVDRTAPSAKGGGLAREAVRSGRNTA